ncbi:MAG: response regulator [Bacteroidota bacterium]
MTKANILIVEDDAVTVKLISQCLQKLGYNVMGISSEAQDAVNKAQELIPDLVLMDIMLKGEMTGIEAAAKIYKNLHIPVIFLTIYADEETLKMAKIAEPFGYIIKPFEKRDLQIAIEIALHKHKKEFQILKERDLYYSIIKNRATDGILFAKSNGHIVPIKINEIFFIEGLKDYVVINLSDESFRIRSTLKNIMDKLPAYDFVRMHKSYIVSIEKIKIIDDNTIMIEHTKKYIPIGITYKEELMRRINVM